MIGIGISKSMERGYSDPGWLKQKMSDSIKRIFEYKGWEVSTSHLYYSPRSHGVHEEPEKIKNSVFFVSPW